MSPQTRRITVTRRWSDSQPSAYAARCRSPTAAFVTGRPGRPPETRFRSFPIGGRSEARTKWILRRRGDLLTRPNAHFYETGGMRRVHPHGYPNILKPLLVKACGPNLGMLIRHLTGIGTPRSVLSRGPAGVDALTGHLIGCWGGVRRRRCWSEERHDRPDSSWGGTGDTSIWTRDPRLTNSPYYHGRLGGRLCR